LSGLEDLTAFSVQIERIDAQLESGSTNFHWLTSDGLRELGQELHEANNGSVDFAKPYEPIPPEVTGSAGVTLAPAVPSSVFYDGGGVADTETINFTGMVGDIFANFQSGYYIANGTVPAPISTEKRAADGVQMGDSLPSGDYSVQVANIANVIMLGGGGNDT